MAWRFDAYSPVFIQIASKIKGDIVRGKYPPGSQFPTVRQLAIEAAVNPNTMQRSLSMLEDEGLLFSKGSAGRFVTNDEKKLGQLKDEICLELAKKYISETKMLGIDRVEIVRYINEASEK